MVDRQEMLKFWEDVDEPKVDKPNHRPIAYVSGPYSAKTIFGIIRNIYIAWKVARILWGNGYTVICPHANSALMNTVSNEDFIERDLGIVERCDVVFMLPNWRKSTGAVMEFLHAEIHNKDIIVLGHIKDAHGFKV